ncbi:MAG: TRAP transporter small permease [Pyramidobacter sp.]|nr:TRAP transporter small permease [Pyramidobacter sp.]
MPLKKLASSAVNFLETVIPPLSFLVLFIVFLIAIVTRYVLKQPTPWTMEVSVLAYMWTVYFGAAWCTRTDSNVVFSLVYDSVSARAQKFFRVAQNMILIAFMGYAFIPFTKRILKMSTGTGVLNIPFRWAYLPFIVMTALVMLHCAAQILRDCTGTKPEEARR